MVSSLSVTSEAEGELCLWTILWVGWLHLVVGRRRRERRMSSTSFKVLACPPVPELCAKELAALSDSTHVSTLEFDGSIADEADVDAWDAAFITPQAFIAAGSREKLFGLYDRLAALVAAGKVRYVHLCAAGVDVTLFHSVIRACITNDVLLSH